MSNSNNKKLVASRTPAFFLPFLSLLSLLRFYIHQNHYQNGRLPRCSILLTLQVYSSEYVLPLHKGFGETVAQRSSAYERVR